jgi:hypothetical protein
MTAASQTHHAETSHTHHAETSLPQAAQDVDGFQTEVRDSGGAHLAPASGLGRVVVGFDGSSSGRDALRFGVVLARSTNEARRLES